MPELFIYLIKVNVALLVFCAGYYLVLRRLTFYTLNRIYLVTAIIFSTLYPRVNLIDFLNRHEQISRPVQVVVINWQGQVNNLTQQVTQHDKWYWLQMAFWAGVVLFAVRLLIQLVSLYKLHKRSEPAQVHNYFVRSIKGDINPFSFWRSIYLNPDNHEPEELKAILEHEQIHVNEWHTLDILLGEISTIFYWFNPGIWLMKRAIRENIEFITDRRILQKGMDSKAYQYSLLNVNFGSQNNAIVNNFNISTIKKRIMMMNTKRSSRINITRYLLLVPAVMVLLLVFSVSKAELGRHIRKTGTAMVKVFNNAVVTTMNGLTQPAAPAKPHKTKPAKIAKTVIKVDNDGPVDTIKKGSYILVTPTNHEIEYYINDKKVGKDEFQAIDPSTVEHIEVNKTAKTGQGDKSTVRIILKGFKGKADSTGNAIILRGSGANNMYTDSRIRARIIEGQPITAVRINGKGLTTTGMATYSYSNDSVYVTSAGNVKPLRLNIIRDTAANHRLLKQMANGKGYVEARDVIRFNNSKDTVITVIGHPAKLTQAFSTFSIAGGISPTQPLTFDNKLFIVDGKEVTEKQLKKISAADIKSISILKDAAAKATYGDKGNNGVVIITTK